MFLDPSSLTVTPKAMQTSQLVQRTDHTRPELGSIELASLEETPTEESEEMILEETEKLGEAIRTRELTAEMMQLRKEMRGEYVGLYKEGLKDKKDSIKTAAKLTKANGDFARFLQSALLDDRKEERFATGYKRLAEEAVTMF